MFVRFGKGLRKTAQWKLCIEDDGRGMRTWGTASVAGLPALWRPAVIEERVRSMGGTLRLPLTELSPEFHAVVVEAMFAAGISVE